MTCIKRRRKVAKVFAIFVIGYTREIIKETEKLLSKLSLHAGGWMVEKTGFRNEVASWIRAAKSGPG